MELKDLIASEKAADVTLSVGKGAKRGWQEGKQEREGGMTD